MATAGETIETWNLIGLLHQLILVPSWHGFPIRSLTSLHPRAHLRLLPGNFMISRPFPPEFFKELHFNHLKEQNESTCTFINWPQRSQGSDFLTCVHLVLSQTTEFFSFVSKPVISPWMNIQGLDWKRLMVKKPSPPNKTLKWIILLRIEMSLPLIGKWWWQS